MSKRTYDGDPLDGTVQYLGEAPHWGDDDEDETVYATPPEDPGSETTENVPTLGEQCRPEISGQTTLTDWECGSVDDE